MPDNDEATQVMPDNPEFIALAAEAKKFESSMFGSYLLNMAAKEAGDAARALCDVNPEDTTKIVELQSKTKRLRDLERWMQQAINVGEAEYAEYQRKLGGEE